MRDGATLAAVGLGGAAGAAARYSLELAWPEDGTGFPWTTFAINLTGCLAIGRLLATLEPLTAPHPLIRPSLGTGFLGGFTTLSAYADQTRILLSAGRLSPRRTPWPRWSVLWPRSGSARPWCGRRGGDGWPRPAPGGTRWSNAGATIVAGLGACWLGWTLVA